MTRYQGEIKPGDVLVTREGGWPWANLIRLGEAFAGTPSMCNHVIVASHIDDNGTFWGIEGRPGGVGDRDLSGPLSWPLTNANNRQPKTDDQRARIVAAARLFLGRPYDWKAIAEDTREALHMAWGIPMAKEWRDGEVPGHVVCSSFLDWVYTHEGLANPGGAKRTRMTTPGNWDRFIMNREWGA